MLISTELSCGVKINSCSYDLDLLTRGLLHLSKRWASGWSRPSHLLYESAGQPSPMAGRSHSTRSMVSSKALISGVALQEVCDAAGCTHSSDFIIWTWTLPQVPRCSRPSAAHLISHRTGTRRYGDVVLTFPKRVLRNGVPLKGNVRLYNCNLGSLKRKVPGLISFVPVSDFFKLVTA